MVALSVAEETRGRGEKTALYWSGLLVPTVKRETSKHRGGSNNRSLSPLPKLHETHPFFVAKGREATYGEGFDAGAPVR